jgi:D-alanyl-D-alanine carboxypeptidase/D-alanyl-D-alanine-endopeptidase (penicillin-binding protein 4)
VKLGARVVDLSSGRVILDLNGEQPMVPASNMKLMVICASLDTFGKDYQFKTTLATRGNDLVVIGGGDPTFGDERLAQKQGKSVTGIFQSWAAKLKAAGITHVKGNIVIDDSVFDREFIHPHWPAPQFQAWYEAPIGGLNFASNCVDVSVKPTKPGSAAEVCLVPPNTFLDIANKSVTGAKQSVSATRPREKDTILVSGSVAKGVKLGPISVRDPGLYFGCVLKTVLAANGIHVDGNVVRQSVHLDKERQPADSRVIDTYHAPITWALARAGKQSLGMMAEAMIKLLGWKSGGVGSWENGRHALTSFLQKAKVPASQFIIDDGSGLSRNNRLAPAASTAVLQYMFNSKGGQFETLLEVLAHAGIDGTLEKRMKSAPTKGRVFAKTGYIDGVRTLAGYVQTKTGKWVAFAFFYNGAASTKPLSNLQDQACKAIVEWNGE